MAFDLMAFVGILESLRGNRIRQQITDQEQMLKQPMMPWGIEPAFRWPKWPAEKSFDKAMEAIAKAPDRDAALDALIQFAKEHTAGRVADALQCESNEKDEVQAPPHSHGPSLNQNLSQTVGVYPDPQGGPWLKRQGPGDEPPV